MKKLFKSIDDKFAEIGFEKVCDDQYSATYERKDNRFGGYTQVLSILHKNSGRHIVQSYDKDLYDVKKIGNTCVGLTHYELKLVMKKMRKKKWHKDYKRTDGKWW